MNGELLRGDFTYVFVFVLSAQLHCYIHKLDSWRRLFWNEATAHCRWKANKLRWGTYINDVLFFGGWGWGWGGGREFWPPIQPWPILSHFSLCTYFMIYRPCPIMSYFGWPHPTQKLDIIYGRVLLKFSFSEKSIIMCAIVLMVLKFT